MAEITDGTTTVTLPDNLLWEDEFGWSPVAQATDRTLTGSQIVEETAKSGGRPITLSGLWLDRATVQSLRSLEAQVATEMTLTLPGGATHNVLWRRGDSEPAVRAEPIRPVAPDVHSDSDLYEVTLRLMEANS